MHLTRFTDLSLRVLIYLTHNERKGLVTVTELAERFKEALQNPASISAHKDF